MVFGIAAAATATAGSAGLGLFSYNRGNYMLDQKNHYARFTAGLNMAISQTSMYKQDITDLTNLTVTRQDCYQGIAAMGLTIVTAIYCSGKMGLHVPAPPGWLMGLAFVNIAGCFMFLGLTLWLAMHASMRADTAAKHMLSRFVRLPVPSQGMLDKARKFLASFEEQPLQEVFRIPFTQHLQVGENKGLDELNEGMRMDRDARKRARHSYDVPVWYHKEKAIDSMDVIDTTESMMPFAARGAAPEHFEAYRELQHEWFAYDVYARLSIFLAFMHMIHCWGYQQIGHQLAETRALFACAIVVLPMFVLQELIITLDIIPNTGLHRLESVHRLGPVGMWAAYIAAIIEYRRWFSPGVQAVGFVFVYIAYILHIIYTLQLIRICAPAEDPPAVADSPGASWWPGEWRLPAAFQHALFLVAPPKELEGTQHDLAGELRAAQGGGTPKFMRQGSIEDDRRRDVHRALSKQGESAAWFIVRMGLYALLVAWLFLTVGFTVEVMNQGTAHPSLLSAPGMPQNSRDPRYRPAKPGEHEPTEVGTGGVLAGPAKGLREDAVHRRLVALELQAGSVASSTTREELAHKLRAFMQYLQQLAAVGSSGSGELGTTAAAPTAEPLLGAASTTQAMIDWPALFEPRLLACATSRPVTAVLSRHGRGVVVEVPGAGSREAPAKAAAFTLEGLAGQGPLLAASWEAEGLLLLAQSGALHSCPGSPAAGSWRCAPRPGAKLPLPLGRALAAAAIARSAAGTLRAAVLLQGDSSVLVFSRADRANAPWLPSGEVTLPVPATSASLTARAEALLFTAEDGAIARMHMEDGSVVAVAPAMAGYDGHSWPSSCRLPSGSLARLALATAGRAGRASEVKLFFG